jgi:MFS family permease
MPVAAYLDFILSNRRFVAFGFAMAMVSSFGQTYFIGVFGPSLQGELDLSHTAWSSIYLIGTIGSAFALPWTGKLIDDVGLHRYTLAVLLLLAGACAFLAGVTAGVITLAVAIFLLRQGGQGLASHVAVTSMTRYYDSNRGRAIAVATLGFGAGEAILPVTAVFFIGEVGWRWTYGGAAIAVAVVVIPLITWLLRGHEERHRLHVDAATRAALETAHEPRQASWTRGQVLRDPRFYLLLPGLLAPALIITALFFHHLTIAAAKGWSGAWITGNYVIFAAASTLTSLTCGPLIDRFGGRRLAPVMLLPLAAGLGVLASFDGRATVPIYFVLIGISTGIAHTAIAALWAELYGVGHIGAIRSLVSALGVFASALGPITMGALIDAGVTIGSALSVLAAYAVIGAALISIALRSRREQPPS